MECDNGLSESGTMDIVVTLPHTEAWPSDGGVLVSLAGGQHDEELVDLVGFCISQHSISHTQTQVNTTQVRYIRIRSSFLCCLTYFKSTSRFISKGPCLAYAVHIGSGQIGREADRRLLT